MAIPLGKPSDKADRPERRPGLELAQRGAGRGASCRKRHCETGRYCCRSRTPSFADRVAAAPGSLPLRGTLCCSHKRAAAQLALRAQINVRAKRPGLGLAQRGAGRGASCRKKHFKSERYCCRSPHQVPMTVSRQPPAGAALRGSSQGIAKAMALAPGL